MDKVARALALLALSSLPVLAQPAESSWDNLSQLRAGQKIEIVNKKLKPIEGRFSAYTEEAVSLRVGADEVSVPRGEVLVVKNRERSHRLRNTMLGLAIGAGGGLAAGAIRGATYHESGETGVFALVFTPIGAGIGAGVGAALPAGQVTIYRAPSERGLQPTLSRLLK